VYGAAPEEKVASALGASSALFVRKQCCFNQRTRAFFGNFRLVAIPKRRILLCPVGRGRECFIEVEIASLSLVSGAHKPTILFSKMSLGRATSSSSSPNGHTLVPHPVMPQTSIGSQLHSSSMDFSFSPLSFVPSTIIPSHFSHSVKITIIKVSLVQTAVGKGTNATSMAFASRPATGIDGSIRVVHFSSNHVSSNMFPFKYSAIFEF
jgi:hypothetical protein